MFCYCLFQQKILKEENKLYKTGVNFINIFRAFFCTKFWRQSQNVTRKSCQNVTFVRKTLMKLTPGVKEQFIRLEQKGERRGSFHQLYEFV